MNAMSVPGAGEGSPVDGDVTLGSALLPCLSFSLQLNLPPRFGKTPLPFHRWRSRPQKQEGAFAGLYSQV